MRLIDAEILAFDIKVKRDWLDTSSVVGRGEYIALNKALVMIDEQPTIDAVEVVHCRECKHLGENDGYYFCNAIGIAFGDKTNWFCADGERRSND